MKVDLGSYEELGYRVSFLQGALISMEKHPRTTQLSSHISLLFIYPGIYRLEFEILSPDGAVRRGLSEGSLPTLMRYMPQVAYGIIESYLSGATTSREILGTFNKYRQIPMPHPPRPKPRNHQVI